jgi:flagellar biosynthetic protein FliR
MNGSWSPELTWLSLALILARVSAFIAAFPLFAGKNLPRLVKIGWAMSLAWMWFGVYGVEPTPAIQQLAASPQGLAMVLGIVRETILGLVLGFGFGLFVAPLRIAGDYIAEEMGLTLASVADPTQGDLRNVVGQLLESLGVLLFFALNLHHSLLLALHVSLQRWPIGSLLPRLSAAAVVGGVDDAQQWGLLLAAPVGACLFATTVALVILARMAPQLNLFSIGLTVRLGVGLLAFLVFLPDMWLTVQQLFGRVTELMQRMIV